MINAKSKELILLKSNKNKKNGHKMDQDISEQWKDINRVGSCPGNRISH